MRKYMKSIILIMFCMVQISYVQAQDPNDPNNPEQAAVKIVLTKFDVNDTRLELGWKITNNTDHNVWICDSLHQVQPSIFEMFLDKDNRTLLIRRRFNIQLIEALLWKYPPVLSRYVRLLPGQEKAESQSFSLPVQPDRISAKEYGNAEYAERLSIEIGFYDEDLPELILKIVELAEHFNCDLDVGLPNPNNPKDSETCRRFFGGRNIAMAFKHTLGWSSNITSGDDDIWMPYFGLDMGEEILQLTVDGVSIPYRSTDPPLMSQEDKEVKDEQTQQANIPGKNKAKTDKG